MGSRLLVDAIVVAHLAFIGYLVAGGFLAWRWRRTIWLHIPVVAWGFASVIVGVECPLTHLENGARHAAGMAGLPATGFIDHYLTGVIYPDSTLAVVRMLVAACVIGSWCGFVARGGARPAHRSDRTLAP